MKLYQGSDLLKLAASVRKLIEDGDRKAAQTTKEGR